MIAQSDDYRNIFNAIEEESNSNTQLSGNEEVNELLEKRIEINKNTETISGWRIRIYSDIGKDARSSSLRIKNDFLDKYYDIPVYREYISSYFKVYIGDFRTRTDAYKVLREIKKDYPTAFIVYTKINYPKL
ncbi:MAG: SPOR domain-containing protein [Bacteroidota bacterium]